MGMTQPTGGHSPQSRVRTTPFGKYLLLDRIAVGGMAEVFLAKSFGIEGFEKIIAVKRILPTMAEDEDFIEMFIDEAKIAGHLNHANIVPIYELGKIGDSHYIAMEYIWGKDLLQMMNRFRKMRKRMPAAMVSFVAARMCEALEYAHSKRDRNGNPLNLIHRDISPQNILVSYEGAVKLIDFGIAKAASRTTTTQAGVLKGKFGYMSPEQVRGLPIDHRSDIFAVGTCMYEMLTADRLFVGESDFSTLEKVRHAAVRPPSEIIRDLPKEFEDIVMKALARNVDDRWQSAGELHEALQQFMVTQRPAFTTSKLAAWMNSAFAEEVAKEKRKLDSYASVTRPTPPPPPPPRLTARPAPPAPVAPSPFDSGVGELDELEGESTMISASPFDAMQEAQQAQQAAQQHHAPHPMEELDSEPTQIFFSADDMEEVLDEPRPSAGPLRPQMPGPLGPPPGPPPPLAAPPRAGGIVLGGGEPLDSGTRPTLTAVPADEVLPAGPVGFDLPPMTQAQTGTQEIARPVAKGDNDNKKKIIIGAIALIAALAAVVGLVLAMTGSSTGTIEIRTLPSNAGAEVRIDGVARGHAPVRIEGIPAGTAAVSLVAEGYETWEEQVTVAEGGISTLSVALVVATPSEAPAVAAAPTENPSAMAQAPAVPTPAENTNTAETAPTPEPDPEPEADPEPDPEPERVAARDPNPEPSRMRNDSPMTRPRITMSDRTAMEDTPSIMRIVRNTPMEASMGGGGRGTLIINTIPWAEVYVDGRSIGRNTPVRGYRIRAGHHRIGLKTQDGRMHNVEVDVPAGDTVRIMRRLN